MKSALIVEILLENKSLARKMRDWSISSLTMKYIKGIITGLILIINTVVLVTLLMVFALFKLILPWSKARVFVSKILTKIAETWVSINSASHRLLHGEKTLVKELPDLDKDSWYLVVANHQSTTDIPVIQAVLNHKIPFLKFFLKQELIWVPFLGLAWWALDFPFMKRYNRAFLEKNPHLKGKDMEQTQKSCAKFKDFPISVINFMEGTRFSTVKQAQQQSPYQYLLKPKAGGIGYVMGSMGNQIKHILLVTVAYQPKAPTVWQYLCGNYEQATVFCEKIVIPESFLGKNYQIDADFRADRKSVV